VKKTDTYPKGGPHNEEVGILISEARNGRITVLYYIIEDESSICCGYFEDMAIVWRNSTFQQQINPVA
jgi:hypothetical protein